MPDILSKITRHTKKNRSHNVGKNQPQTIMTQMVEVAQKLLIIYVQKHGRYKKRFN